MERIPERELINTDEQVEVYANANFEKPHSQFIPHFERSLNLQTFTGYAIDMGCGPGDISRRFALAYPSAIIHAVDGSRPMLAKAVDLFSNQNDLKERVHFIYGILPNVRLPRKAYDALISNSLLHHLYNPEILWEFINFYSQKDSLIFVMDLVRPQSVEEAEKLVKKHAADESRSLHREFCNSLCAAFSIEEIEGQLINANLTQLNIEQVSDHHIIISGLQK